MSFAKRVFLPIILLRIVLIPHQYNYLSLLDTHSEYLASKQASEEKDELSFDLDMDGILRVFATVDLHTNAHNFATRQYFLTKFETFNL